MFNEYKPTTLSDVKKALQKIESIEVPNSDCDGMPINHPDTYNYLSREDQESVDNAEILAKKYLKKGKRAITELNKSGFKTYYGQSQHNPDSNDGSVTIGNWELDVSDR